MIEMLAARIKTKGQKQVLVLEFSASTEGFREEIELLGPSQEVTEAVAVTVLGFVEDKFLTLVDRNPVAFDGVKSVYAHNLTAQCLAKALKDRTFQFRAERA